MKQLLTFLCALLFALAGKAAPAGDELKRLLAEARAVVNTAGNAADREVSRALSEARRAVNATDRQIELDTRWGGHSLPWASAPSDTWRRGLPLVWRPPSYNDRIPAQNSAFLIGGVPQVYAGDNAK